MAVVQVADMLVVPHATKGKSASGVICCFLCASRQNQPGLYLLTTAHALVQLFGNPELRAGWDFTEPPPPMRSQGGKPLPANRDGKTIGPVLYKDALPSDENASLDVGLVFVDQSVPVQNETFMVWSEGVGPVLFRYRPEAIADLKKGDKLFVHGNRSGNDYFKVLESEVIAIEGSRLTIKESLPFKDRPGWSGAPVFNSDISNPCLLGFYYATVPAADHGYVRLLNGTLAHLGQKFPGVTWQVATMFDVLLWRDPRTHTSFYKWL